MEQNDFYEFGSFRLDARRRLLLRENEPVSLTPKAFDTLLVLVQQRNRVLEKDELMTAIWGDTIVEESGLARNISVLRKLLGENKDEHQFIITIPGRGYQFVAAVREGNEEISELLVQESKVRVVIEEESAECGVQSEELSSAPAPMPDAQSAAPKRLSRRFAIAGSLLIAAFALGYWWNTRHSAIRTPNSAFQSLAVLPFRSLQPGENYLGVGLADVMITRLSNINSLAVRPTNSVLRFAEQDPLQAGKALQVDTVLDGSVQQIGDRVRVTVRLLRVSDGQSLWAYQCDERCTDVFQLQDTISAEVTSKLALQLSGNERERLTRRYTNNQQAWESYAKGRYYRSRASFKELPLAIAAFQQALQSDPKFALAHAALADAYVSADYAQLTENERAQAKAAAQKAIALDEELAEAHVSLGIFYFYADWQFAAAEREFKRAVALNPGLADARLWHGTWLALMGQFDASIAELKLAAQLDPLSPMTRTWAGLPYFLKHDWEQGIAWNIGLLETNPNLPMVQVNLAICYAEQGAYDKAIAGFERVRQAEPGFASNMDLLLTYTHAKAGNRLAAESALQRALTAGDNLYAYDAALAYGRLGNKDQAFAWLEKAYQQRLNQMTWLNVDPRWQPLRDDQRFHEMLHRVGLN